MNKKYLIIGALIVMAILIGAIVFFVLQGEQRDERDDIGRVEPDTRDFYPGAPDPASDLEIRDQIKRLWPDVFEKKPDPEKVKREWAALAKRHPNNFYLPPEFRPAMTKEQRRAHRKRLEAYTHVAAAIAAKRSKSKYDKPGTKAPEIDLGVSPEDQRVYFKYRIHELESRMQLLEFAFERKGLDPDQTSRAKREMQEWKKELNDLKEKSEGIKKEKAE